MKLNPEQLREAAQDLQGWLHRHPDVAKAEPEITRHVIQARDLAERRYRAVSDARPEPAPKTEGFVP